MHNFTAPTPHIFPPSIHNHPIIGFQTPETRALTVGYIQKAQNTTTFVPCRVHLGQQREHDTYKATVQSLLIPDIQKILKKYPADEVSTITLLRETVACHLSLALYDAGIKNHHGDCFIGANHVKTNESITTNYAYENTEGLAQNGLWIMADSIAAGRNLIATMKSLLSKYTPKELIFIVPIGNRYGINQLADVVHEHSVHTTFIVWGALFGLNPVNHYDEPWGLPDCEPIDKRDQKTFIDMYAPNLCVGGDFGNDYYCPPLAMNLYHEQLKQLGITPKIPTVEKILKIYKTEELITRTS